MPFITEEIWHALQKRVPGDDLIVAQWPEIKRFDKSILTDVSFLFEIISNIRNIRNKNQIARKIKLILKINSAASHFESIETSLTKIANLKKFHFQIRNQSEIMPS